MDNLNASDLLTIYADLRQTARQMAEAGPQPDFYRDFAVAVARSRRDLETSVYLGELAETIRSRSPGNLGHGLGHAWQVALDAGAVAAVEAEQAGCSSAETIHMVLLAHCAGLLHDIARSAPDHAAEGARVAHRHLERAGVLDGSGIDLVTFAIRHHEAFKPVPPSPSTAGHIVSGSLYDADKFRWGPDNFTHTLWQMIQTAPPPLPRFVGYYPRAMAVIADIKTTFRTRTGRAYGPQFIDMGLDIGNRLLAVIRSRYGHLLP
ncbi:HD domain-containing protein [Desulfosudis oleivorans]|uniref:HD domain-containing protein n=1 Tax=Desulfosudis oleivorans TaxID=181663 RepID=UPI0012947698|nr:HD domain-containing protein [Desulfosudis oleivorans]